MALLLPAAAETETQSQKDIQYNTHMKLWTPAFKKNYFGWEQIQKKSINTFQRREFLICERRLEELAYS